MKVCALQGTNTDLLLLIFKFRF